MDIDLKKIQSIIGYTFQNEHLLRTAFTHSSYSNETGEENNERLEFLGDAIMNATVSLRLYELGINEGNMTKIRQSIVSRVPLENAINRLGLEPFILSSGKVGFNLGKKAISSLFEAIVAAIYLDGGILPVREFITKQLLHNCYEPHENYKGTLQEYVQRGGDSVAYTVVEKSGEAHNPEFTVEAAALGKRATASGCSRREAEQRAAADLLSQLRGFIK